MELRHVILYTVLCINILLSVQAQVTFNPDPDEDIQLQTPVLTPPVEVTTIECYQSSPTFRVQYVTLEANEAVYTIPLDLGIYELPGNPIDDSACGHSVQLKYRVTLSNLAFIADSSLVGGTFKLKVTLVNIEGNSTFSKRTYTFPAPFNMTGSSLSAVLSSEFTWTCHVTSDYPIIEWVTSLSKTLVQSGTLQNGTCVTFNQNDSYTYQCHKLNLTYTLTIPGPSLTEELQGSTWRCREVNNETKGSRFMKLDIIVPVTTVTISPGNGSTLNADENQNLTFTCTTNDANPPPTILWYIGSSDVTSQATGSNRTTLTLNATRVYHEVSIRCMAWNTGNTANTSDSTTLIVRFPPAGNEPLQIMGYNSSQVLYENNSALISISCTQPGGNPVANVTFTCGSQTGSNENTATEAIRRLNLTTNRDLNGQNCTCVSTHINGYIRSQRVSFTVYYPPSTPNIMISSPFPWKENESKSFTCNTTPGNPVNTTYIWKLGDSVLSTTSQMYSINPLQPTDNGKQLTCQVNNNFTLHQDVTLTSDAITLQVEYPPRNDQELQIIGYISGQVLYENTPAMISIYCTQRGGNPVVNMTFTCGSKTGTNKNNGTDAIRNITLTNNRSLDGTQCVCTSTHINDFKRSTSVNFTIYYPPSAPTISTSSQFPWKATERKSLTCNTNPGNPKDTTYIWKDGESDFFLDSQTYEFNPLQPIDGRNLSCQVNNNFTIQQNIELTSTVTTLKVEYDPVVKLEQSSVEVIEGQTIVLRCSATGNPAPTVTWYRGSTQVVSNAISSNHSIVNISRTATGNYTCVARSSTTGSNVLQQDQMTLYLRVFYPPPVILSLRNTTENTDNHVIWCSAVGDPNNTTYRPLEQKIGSTSIRNITSFTVSSPGNITLTISTVSYQDMGTYTSLASNGIPDRNNQKIQLNRGYFNVITSAKFEKDQYTVRSDIDTEAVVRIPFYRNPPAFESDVVWTRYTGTSNETLGTSANVSLSLNDADVQQTLHGVDVTLRGQSATMDITSFQNIYEGNYTLKIRSSHTDSAEVQIALIRSDTPSDFQLLTRKVTSIVLTWNKGSDGGHPQTFLILYREKTSEIYTMKQLEDTTMNRNITHEIKSLRPGTSYEFLLYSFNEKGNSTSHRPLEERTLKAPEESSLSSLNSGLVGGAAGGGAAVLVVVIVIIVVMRRRHNHGKGNDSKGILNSKEMLAGTSRQNDYDDGEDGLKDNPLYGSGASGTSGTNAVQGAGAAPENPSLYAEVIKPKKKYPAKVSEDPPPIYAEVDKSNKKGKGPLKPKRKSSTKRGEDPPPIYAEVNKPNKKGDKGKQKQKKAKGKIEGDVYENVREFKEKETQFNDPAVKSETKENEPRG